MATRKASHSHNGSEGKGTRKVHKVMDEHKEGKLKSGNGKKVTSRKQAVCDCPQRGPPVRSEDPEEKILMIMRRAVSRGYGP